MHRVAEAACGIQGTTIGFAALSEGFVPVALRAGSDKTATPGIGDSRFMHRHDLFILVNGSPELLALLCHRQLTDSCS